MKITHLFLTLVKYRLRTNKMKEVEWWLATVEIKCVISMYFQAKIKVQTTIFYF